VLCGNNIKQDNKTGGTEMGWCRKDIQRLLAGYFVENFPFSAYRKETIQKMGQ